MWVVLVVIVSVVLAVGLYVGLMSSGIVPKPEGDGRGPVGATTRGFRQFGGSDRDTGNGLFGIFPRVPHLRELPQGCLLALIVVAALWFIGWTVALVLAIGLLRSIS
jgi:hypothetical protein